MKVRITDLGKTEKIQQNYDHEVIVLLSVTLMILKMHV